MIYFKHSELVDNYRVSLKTIHNWIDATKQGKLSLQLYELNNRTYIANTRANLSTLEQLAAQGKKYRNTRHHKIVTPDPRFYELYSRRQILDIISNIMIHREIPRQYNYIDQGAISWDTWLQQLHDEQGPNILKGTIDLVQADLGPLDILLKDRKHINVIDVGVGNALPVRNLLTHLLERGLLHRYIAIDISEKMLHIAERNIKEWFGDKVKFEGHVRDISFERFDDLIVNDMLGNEVEHTTNLVLLFGATLMNFRSPADVLRVIYGSMGESDLFAYTTVKDQSSSESPRRYFSMQSQAGHTTLAPTHSFILDLMNIDQSLYDAESGFDEQKRMRYVRIRLKTALTIDFKFGDSKRSVSLEKGDTITMLRVWHQKTLEIISEFDVSGFTLLQANVTNDRQYILTVSEVDKK